MASSGRIAPLALCVLLFCALASTAAFLLSASRCTYSLTRTILAVSGLDPYIVSCAEDAPTGPLSTDDGLDNKPGGPIVMDLLLCGKPDIPPDAIPPVNCCPPMSASEPVNFTFPDPAEPLRTRRPAHAVGADYMAKYERAVALMKALPKSDPRSFYQQANIHCAYCTGAYRQVGHPELRADIHFSWLFFPLHRAYLYFFERIAAKLLGDPGFGIPFWSWDVPEGMRIPAAFADRGSPLYDPLRHPGHAPPRLVDLDFMFVEKNYTDEQQIQHNLRIMYKQMISNAPLPSLFYGQPFRAGESEHPGPGTVEHHPHNTMHVWTGDISRPNLENMGGFYAAGRDPLFYPHHANIDRLWKAWCDLAAARGNRRQAYLTDSDWLNSSFLLYDEEARLVRVTVRDMLDSEKLRYTYDGVGLPWLNARPPVTPDVNRKNADLTSVRFPVSLDAAVTAEVRRPGVLRTLRNKDIEEEVLVVEGIETDGTEFVKFDVYVNAMEYEKVGPSGREMAGSFVRLKHHGDDGGADGKRVETSLRVALNELLEDLDAEGDESVTVTFVPRRGKVRIGGLRIVYMVV